MLRRRFFPCISFSFQLPFICAPKEIFFRCATASSSPMRHGTHNPLPLTFQLNLQLPFINGRAFKFSFFVLRFHSAVPPLNSAESLNNALKRYRNISSTPTSPLHLSSPGDSRDSNYIFSPFLRSLFSCLVFSAPAVTLKQMKWHLEYKTIKKIQQQVQ